MAKSSLAHPEHKTTTEPTPGYVLRGLGIFELYSEEILESYQGGGRWLIPSGSTEGLRYEVRVGTRPERCRCECVGYQHHKHCSHIEAARRAHRRSAVCDACGTRTWWPKLTQVHEDDGLLAFFPGDVVCDSCIREGVWG